MTHHVIRTEPDGTRVYSNYTRYRPKKISERTNAVRKPDDPRAVRWYGDWLLPLDLLPDGERAMPETRPDTDAYDHMTKPRKCICFVCRRPEAQRWKEKWMDDNPRSERTLRLRPPRRRRRRRPPASGTTA